MIVWVELSGENLPLGSAEALAAASALGGRGAVEGAFAPGPGFAGVELPDPASVSRFAERIALARRCLAERGDGSLSEWLRGEGAKGETATFQWLSRSAGPESLRAGLVEAFRSSGGRLDLAQPERRFWLAMAERGAVRLLEEVASIDRRAYGTRRLPLLPFRRPVTLPPRLARAAANLARLTPGELVVDPFVGTGALLVELGLLGARLVGFDRDPAMIRGAVQNLAHFSLSAERLGVGDSEEAARRWDGGPIDAIVTDPPYGRASGTGGEPAVEVRRRVMEAWAHHVRPSGRIVVIVPAGEPALAPPWRLEHALPQRVHRSLTREFRVYGRTPLSRE